MYIWQCSCDQSAEVQDEMYKNYHEEKLALE